MLADHNMNLKYSSHPKTSMTFAYGETWMHWEITDETKDVEKRYIRREVAKHLRNAIRRLKPNLRTVVEIHQSNEGSVQDVADVAGISLAATRTRLSRARTILRGALS
jgi:RNA polymerase sigma-70 factor, ECF subfamily